MATPLLDWLISSGLRGLSEAELLRGFCEQIVAAGVPVTRGQVLIDSLHPIYEGRIVRWSGDNAVPVVGEYGRTSGTIAVPCSAEGSGERDAVAMWRASPFYFLSQNGDTVLRRRITPEAGIEFPVLQDYRDLGLTDYVAMVNQFGDDGSVGEMDCVYSSWVTAKADGFSDAQINRLTSSVPALALATKSVALSRTITTVMTTYLGRDPARKVISGRIMRGATERMRAVIWFSDLRGFTRIADGAPEHVIPMLSDYADAIVSAIHESGGDVLKFIGDGILAIFPGEDRDCARAAVAAAVRAARAIGELNMKRQRENVPVTEMYAGLHLGDVLYGNIGSADRLDFTVVGPAVNEASRIAAMCHSVDQRLLMSEAFARTLPGEVPIASVGRYALRGVARSQELFTLDGWAQADPSPSMS